MHFSMNWLMSVSVASLALGGACSSGKSPGNTTGTGGNNTGGSAVATGGTGAGTGGAALGSGGTSVATGGSTASTGGMGIGTGGRAMGGQGPGTGGAGMATGGAPPACQAPVPVTGGIPATVTVNLAATPTATVGPDFMGIHTSVYDGNIGAPSTIDLVKAVGVTSLRYPGGSYGDLYHFETNRGTMTNTNGAGSNVVYIAPGADFGSFASVLASVGANALITINYGTNPADNGPGLPQEAAAWVAYANALPSNATVIGMDASPTPRDWMTAGYWATLRASPPLATDDGLNFLRINHPVPLGVKYWEIGNEIYGNGFYYGGNGWEPDMHLPYPATGTAANRMGNAALSPTTYGTGVRAFSTAMKAVDPTVKIGAIVNWPDTTFANFNRTVLMQSCASIDFVVNHYYAGSTIASLLPAPGNDIPAMFRDLRTVMTANCPAGVGATMPIAITEWSPNPNVANEIQAAYAAMPMTNTQTFGIFAANAYANFMEQGALSVHWHELHGASYLGNSGIDTPTFGYHGAQMAHALASAGDALLPQPPVTNAATLMGLLLTHASRHADGSLSLMITNTSASLAGNVTVNVTGGALGCVGTRTLYSPVAPGMDLDGSVATEFTFSATSGATVSIPVSVPAYSIVVVSFPRG